MDGRATAERHVRAPEAGQLRDAQTGPDRERQQSVVPAAGPGPAIARGEERVDLGVGQVRDEGALEALGRDGQHPGDRRGVLGVPARRIRKQGVDRREPVVPGTRPIAALALEMVEECGDQRPIKIAEVERGWCLGGPGGGEAEEQPERVPIRRHRVRAGPALAEQPLDEERLERWRKSGHHDLPAPTARRAAARSASSGAADRYQYVPAGLTWPRYVESTARSASTSALPRCQSMRVWTAKL